MAYRVGCGQSRFEVVKGPNKSARDFEILGLESERGKWFLQNRKL